MKSGMFLRDDVDRIADPDWQFQDLFGAVYNPVYQGTSSGKDRSGNEIVVDAQRACCSLQDAQNFIAASLDNLTKETARDGSTASSPHLADLDQFFRGNAFGKKRCSLLVSVVRLPEAAP